MSASDLPSLTVLPENAKHSSHNSTVLPPLTSHYPKWSRGKKLDVNGFPDSCGNIRICGMTGNGDLKMNKKTAEPTSAGRGEGLPVTPTSDPLLRITYLEQNIRFLQEQHQAMLASLHHEIEQLKQRNRELQFQLVFSNGGLIQSSPSSPEDDSKPKIILSPKQVNTVPLQVEMLEKEVTELKAALSDSKAQNSYLCGIIEEQKKTKDNEKENEETDTTDNRTQCNTKLDAQNQVESSAKPLGNKAETTAADPDLILKLEEAEKLIRKLRRENEDQRRELATIKSNLSKSVGGSGAINRHLGATANSHRGGGANHHRSQHQQSQSQRFPPLHSQNYWHHGQNTQPHRNGAEYVSHRYGPAGAGRLEKETHIVGRPVPTLPNLRSSASSGYSYSNSNGNNHRRNVHYNSNGNVHYYRGGKDESGENRRYRGGSGRGSRESRESKQ
ncbi:uncharacterized protein LOC126241678 isoform X1 [Schistocerca nitens]|uniref:uncharacterized protein LOC126241678 isoform X1 n=1 Tax=Schistocerca nitens TaxID=7011 RepID=UPI00211746C1|nr:uncharacterized protein LOC126241678 isoform X1 [Schistocerca nitens]